MQARMLGPFQLEEGGRRIPISGLRQRAVLAGLLLRANEIVPSEQLLVDLWGEDSPPGAANALQAAISRLRRALPPGRLITRAPGYALRIFPEELDVSQFEQLVSEGREVLAAGAAAQAARTLRQALSLWQGPALADFRYEPFAQAEIARLEELHLTCLEERVEADLALGSASVLIPELQRLVGEHPVRERLRGQLMLALYRDGRQTEALEVYREFRSVLREELGLDTTPLLRKLEAAILRHDPMLSPASTTTVAPLARRPVTVLCVVLRVASSSGSALDPETQEVVHGHSVAGLTAVLERYGGMLATSAGERLMGVFGAASVHEDDALRAARASLDARSALVTEAGIMLRHGVSLTCRFGLATGEALVGGPGPLGFAGDAETQAVTLAEAAEPGQILISRQTQELAAAAIETESAGPDRFLLRCAHPGVRPLALRLDAPLVGRDQEMHRLEAAYALAVRDRVTVLVTVTGEAGLGKTRLVHEIAGRLGREANVLTGRCLPYGEGITFWPLREVICQAGAGHDSPEAIEALLEGEADAAGVAERLSRALGPGNQGRSDAAEIFWAARRLLETLARPRPLLILLEDLHWAEPTFLDLVESLAVQPGRSALVLVCIARPELLEQRPAWAAGAARAVSIDLTPLDEDSAATLLAALEGDQRIPPLIRARILETAAGNPLYLEQLAVSLSEQNGSETRPVLPPTIEALLAARLQRLGPGASSVLARAAVIGKDFGVRAVRELLPAEARGPLSRNLQTLAAKGLVQRGLPDKSPEEEYSFHHILIQQAAYRAIPKSARAELHHRYADWLEYVVWEPATQRVEILGYHLEQSVRYRSELWPGEAQPTALSRRAAAHLETAGCAAHDRGDALAAVSLLERAAALLPSEDPALARIYTSLGTASTEAGQLERARATLDHAQRIAAANGDEGQRAHARVQALLLALKVNPNWAATEITRALPELRREFDRSLDEPGLCRTLQLQAALDWNHSRSAAAEDAWQRAAEYARRANDRRQLTEILGWLASAALWGPTPAPEGIRRCADYLDEIGNHPSGQAVILLHMAGLHAMQDDIETAYATLNRAKTLLDALGPTMTAAIIQPAAFIAMLAGDPATAETHLRLEYEALDRMGEKGFMATTAAKLAKAIAAQGQSRYHEATQLIAIGREAGAGEDLSTQIIGQGVGGRILADRGRYPEAEELAYSAAALAAQTDLLSERADALLDLAYVLAASGRVSEAHAAATQAHDLYQRKGNLPGVRESLGYLMHYANLLRGDTSMPNSEVSEIELGDEGSLTCTVEVFGFGPGERVEISGSATQANGAIATFYDIQVLRNAGSDGGFLLTVTAAPAPAPSPGFVTGEVISVVGRAARIWGTVLSDREIEGKWKADPPT
jgi:DNA-binding SARP family transcriptional activator/predicted ATPase